jgi:Mrp family chromosome partitioning ATPase
MPDELRFDTSLDRMVGVLKQYLPDDVIQSGLILRDTAGQLTFIAESELTDDILEKCQKDLAVALQNYGRDGRSITDAKTMSVGDLVKNNPVYFTLSHSLWVQILDRRIVGVDWMTPPMALKTSPPRLVFTSLKGGVGRSTALTVVAAHLASEGQNILVVDLDLEAPGIGSLLLSEDRQPRFGALDYLVERNLGDSTVPSAGSMTGLSPLTAGVGLVHVVPVVGTTTIEKPGTFMGKLSRALAEFVSDDGSVVPLSQKLGLLLDHLEAQRPYDLVLIDARAGLSEITAGSLLSLGASILLFGTSQRQTLQDMSYLLAQLAVLTPPNDPGLWQSLKIIHAKSRSDQANALLQDQLWELFSEYIYEEQTDYTGFNYDVHDPEGPHSPIQIPIDANFFDWDPVSDPGQLVPTFYERTFSAIIQYVKTFLH